MNTLLQYFWFVSIPFGPLIGVLVYLEFKPVAEGRPVLKPVLRFLAMTALLFTLPGVLLGIIQLATGNDDPGFFMYNKEFDLAKGLALVVHLGSMAGFLYVLRYPGVCELIAGRSYVRFTPEQLRRWGQIYIVVGMIATLILICSGWGAMLKPDFPR